MKSLILILALVGLSNTVFAGPLNTTIEKTIGTGYMTSMTGGPFIVSIGGDVLGLAMVETGVVLGVTILANDFSSTTDSGKNLKMVKEVINKETADYHMTGEIGLALGAAVTSIKKTYTDLSDAEAIDSISNALN